jgi:hypothetical protein
MDRGLPKKEGANRRGIVTCHDVQREFIGLNFPTLRGAGRISGISEGAGVWQPIFSGTNPTGRKIRDGQQQEKDDPSHGAIFP